jgi:CHAD domain-containing protein
MVDRYFDTADGALATAGYGARLRRTGRRTTLTLKIDIEVTGGLHRREELEARANNELDISQWPPSSVRDTLEAVVGDRRLIESFVVRQRRRERHVSAGGAVLLASIDSGTVFAAGAEAGDIAQFELERVRGRRAVLDRMARAVEASGVAQPEERSKLVIAAEMSADAARVRATDRFAEAGRKVLRRHLLRLLDRETGTRGGEDLALKQMRVATRRMRATWRVFGDAYRKRTRRRFTDELRRVGGALGAVRDLDVLIASAARPKALRPVADHWRERRATAFAEVLRLLDSDEYDRFVRENLAFGSSPGDGTIRRHAKATVADTAPRAVLTAFERLIETGIAAAAASEEDAAWHALRIEGRRFRYSIEAFADVLDAQPRDELLKRVTRMQDHLGAMNDAAVAIDAVTQWLAEADGADAADGDAAYADAAGTAVAEATRAAAMRYVDKRRAVIADLRASFEPVWRDLSDAATREMLHQSLAALTQS